MAKERASWLGLNSYGVFVALLAFLVSTRYFLGPNPWGETHLLANVGHGLYGVAGLGLLVSFWRTRLDLEVYSSILLLGGNLTLLAVRFLGLVPLAPFSAYQLLVSLVLAVAVGSRIAALMKGGTFHLPEWRR